MKLVSFSTFGEVDVLQYNQSHTPPDIDVEEVLVRVHACALSDLDVKVRKGLYKEFTHLPHVGGYEISGVIEKMGSVVKGFKEGDEVTGISPLHRGGGCAEYAAISYYNIVHKDPKISHEEAAATIGPGLKAYTVFHTLMRAERGQYVLILNATSNDAYVALQVAAIWDLKVIVAINQDEERYSIKERCPNIVRVINVSNENLYEGIMKETDGLGVDHIYETAPVFPIYRNSVTKQDIVKCLAVHGRWITPSSDLQLDPPDSLILHLKSASISLLFDHTWVLSGANHGRYLHILQEVMAQLSKGTLSAAQPMHTYTVGQTREAHRSLSSPPSSQGRTIVKP